MPLPPYQFDRRPFWPEPPASAAAATPAAAAAAPDADAIRSLLIDAVAAATDCPAERIADDAPLTQLGLDSLAAADVLLTMERELGRALPDSLVQQDTTIASLTDVIAGASPTS